MNRSMPAGAVIPVLGYDDVAEAAAWLCETFGFTERWRAGSHRAQLARGLGRHVGPGYLRHACADFSFYGPPRT